jgi:hypothetical protein
MKLPLSACAPGWRCPGMRGTGAPAHAGGLRGRGAWRPLRRHSAAWWWQGFCQRRAASRGREAAESVASCSARDQAAAASVQIVCGASNARAGLVSALATVGAVLPDGECASGRKAARRRVAGHVVLGARAGSGRSDSDGISRAARAIPRSALICARRWIWTI